MKPRRYLLLIRRYTASSTSLNWRFQGWDDVWADDNTPSANWSIFEAGQITWPPEGYIVTDASGNPTTKTDSFYLQAALQSGTGSVEVRTDYVVLIPVDEGVSFIFEDTASSPRWISPTDEWVQLRNDDGIIRADICNGPPGGTVTSPEWGDMSYSGGAPILYPGDNKVVLFAVRASGDSAHSDTLALQWTCRKRWLTL
jgi:hypothetical protein